MIEIYHKASSDVVVKKNDVNNNDAKNNDDTVSEKKIDDVIVLDHIQREKGRLKVISQKGVEVRLFLERGNILQRDELLQSACNKLLQVKLAKEPVITARATSWFAFSRACYHLGNRHVRLQLGERWLRFMEDPVLIALVEQLGLTAQREDAEFEPESGAYGHGHAGKAAHHHHDDDGMGHQHKHNSKNQHVHSHEDDHEGHSHQ